MKHLINSVLEGLALLGLFGFIVLYFGIIGFDLLIGSSSW